MVSDRHLLGYDWQAQQRCCPIAADAKPMNAPLRVVFHDHTIPYRPRRHFLPFHNRRERWACLVCHRRAGKTVATLNDTIRKAIDEAKPDGRYAFIAPLRNQVKDIAWEYLKRFAAPALADTPNESELRVTLKSGARIRLYGADNPDALRGGYLDGVVLDEYGDMRPSLWSDVVRPMLADRNGWATFIGTPKGKNGFHEVWAGDGKKRKGAINDPAWFALMLKASQSGILPAHELQDARDEMGEDRYAQEFECSFEAAIRGAFYAEELRIMLEQGRIGRIPIDPAVPVHTAWDLGVSDSTAIWFIQCVARERRLIDYHEASGVGLDYYARLLEEKRKEHRIVYGEYFLPHDIAQRELSTGMSRLDTLRGLGIDPIIVPQHSILDGINATRRMLARTWIDEERCARGLEALRQYRRKWIEHLKDWSQDPLHDWASHGCLVAGTLIDTERGALPIEEVGPGDYARIAPGITARIDAAGLVKVSPTLHVRLSDGASIEASPEHKFFTSRGLVTADKLGIGDAISTAKVPLWNLSDLASARNGMRDAVASNMPEFAIGGGESENCSALKSDESSGSSTASCSLTDSSSRAATSRLSRQTATGRTLRTPTGFFGAREAIETFLRSIPFRSSMGLAITSSLKGISNPAPIMDAATCIGTYGNSTMARYPTDVTFTTRTRTKPTIVWRIWNACRRPITQCCTVGPIHGRGAKPTCNNWRNNAIRRLLGIDQRPEGRGTGSMRPDAVLVVSIQRSEELKPVYDLTVRHHHCYVANGMLVSNSDSLRTFAAGFDDPVGVTETQDRHRRRREPVRSAWTA